MLDKLFAICCGLNRRFPDGNDPFQIIARLLEESGELAKAVNHFEGTGVKRQKYGEPDEEQLAKEVQDVLRCALQVAIYYGIEHELRASIERAYQRGQAEGLIDEQTGRA